MGGFVSPITEPGPVATPGSVFRAIPQTGVLTANDDTLIGGALMDGTVSGGAGVDLFWVTFAGTDSTIEAHAGFGYLTITGPGGAYVGTVSFWDFERFVISAGDGDDTLTGGTLGASTLRGGAGDDLLTVAGGGNLVAGGAGNDTIHGVTLDDTVLGGAGNDLLVVDLSGASAGVNLRAGFNAANWSGIEQFSGTLTGLDDTLHGGALLADANGGAGNDLVRLDYSGLATPVDFWASAGGTAYVSFQQPVGDILSVYLTAFERFVLFATDGGDFLTGSSGNDRFEGLGGNDTLQGGGGRDTLRGGAGDDYISGNLDAGSQLSGGAGNDTINAWRMDDTIAGGAGFDRLQLDLHDQATGVVIDLVSGVPHWTGIESVTGYLSAHNDVFRTTVLYGDIDGGQGIDHLLLDYSRSGADAVEFTYGGLFVTIDGASQFQSASGFERFVLRGSLGNDTLTGDTRSDTLDGAGGNDRLDGGSGNDHVLGGSGNDTLFGGQGADQMAGGAGRDTLIGDVGNDVLTGGSGRDTFYFWGPSTGNDRITDFEAGVDRIVIDPLFEMVPVTQAGVNVLIDIMGQTIRVDNATTAEVNQAIVYDYLFLI